MSLSSARIRTHLLGLEPGGVVGGGGLRAWRGAFVDKLPKGCLGGKPDILVALARYMVIGVEIKVGL